MQYWMCLAILVLLWPVAKLVQGTIWLIGNTWAAVQLLRRVGRNLRTTTEILGG